MGHWDAFLAEKCLTEAKQVGLSGTDCGILTSSGTGAGAVYDVDTIIELIEAGRKSLGR